MEWIEVTGTTIEEAEEHALQMLGIARSDAEFVVLEEPKSGIFKLKRNNARLRARIKPQSFKPKPRQRNQSSKKKTKKTDTAESKKSKTVRSEREASRPYMDKEKQEEILVEFFEGLLDAWNLSGEINFNWPVDHICEISISGDDLNTLIGPKAEVLNAIEEVAKVALRKHATDTRYAQIRLDIAEFRLKRQEALVEFVQKLAEDVKEAGKPKILEPMNNRDRKVVHDALTEIEGISTVSEGENPRRRVKILPEISEY